MKPLSLWLAWMAGGEFALAMVRLYPVPVNDFHGAIYRFVACGVLVGYAIVAARAK